MYIGPGSPSTVKWREAPAARHEPHHQLGCGQRDLVSADERHEHRSVLKGTRARLHPVGPVVRREAEPHGKIEGNDISRTPVARKDRIGAGPPIGHGSPIDPKRDATFRPAGNTDAQAQRSISRFLHVQRYPSFEGEARLHGHSGRVTCVLPCNVRRREQVHPEAVRGERENGTAEAA